MTRGHEADIKPTRTAAEGTPLMVTQIVPMEMLAFHGAALQREFPLG